MSTAPLPADRQAIVYQMFNEEMKRSIRALITEDLIDEYRRQPLGRHSDALERVLNFFRRPPRYGLYARVSCREFQVIRVPLTPGAPPDFVDETVYTDEAAAYHAVFLCHVADLMRA